MGSRPLALIGARARRGGAGLRADEGGVGYPSVAWPAGLPAGPPEEDPRKACLNLTAARCPSLERLPSRPRAAVRGGSGLGGAHVRAVLSGNGMFGSLGGRRMERRDPGRETRPAGYCPTRPRRPARRSVTRAAPARGSALTPTSLSQNGRKPRAPRPPRDTPRASILPQESPPPAPLTPPRPPPRRQPKGPRLGIVQPLQGPAQSCPRRRLVEVEGPIPGRTEGGGERLRGPSSPPYPCPGGREGPRWALPTRPTPTLRTSCGCR